MYCKQCGHRAEGTSSDTCPKCGAKLRTALDLGSAPKARVGWRLPVIAATLGLLVFVGLPRIFLRTDLEPIGPTDKLRFLRAFQRSEYRRVGQREVRVEGPELIVIWDLRWTTLPESKQQEIVRIVGKAWHTVGGEDTWFRIEGQDGNVASYTNQEVHLGP
jgi:hypothetical protein